MNKNPWVILATLALGTLMVGLDRTVVNLAIPRMMLDFNTTISVVGWVSTVYLLTNSIFIPIFGKLSDLYGPRKVYIYGFSGFAIASILTGLSWSIGSLIFFRAVQGLLGASVYPATMAIIASNFKEKEKRAEALGMWTSIIAGSVVLGPLISGPLIDKFSWPAAFLINIPFGIVALYMAFKYLPKNEHIPTSKPFDYKGATSFALTLVGALLVLERGVEWGWTSPLIIVIAIFSVAMFSIFVWLEKRESHPFIPFSLLKNKILLSVLSVSFVSYGTLFGFMFLFSVYVQNILHLNATENGLLLLPLLIAISVVSPFGGKLLKRYKPHVPVILGLLLSASGMGGIVLFYTSVSHAFLVVALCLIGAGVGLTSAPLSTTATTCVAHESVGFASGLLNLTRNIAGVFSISIITILLSLDFSHRSLFLLCSVTSLCTLIPSMALRRSV